MLLHVIDTPKRSHKKKVPDARQQGMAKNFGKVYEPPKRSHKKKGTEAYTREQKKAQLFGVMYGQESVGVPPKRSHKKKVPANTWVDTEASFVANAWSALNVETPPKRSHKKKVQTEVPGLDFKLPALRKANLDYPKTATTFWKQADRKSTRLNSSHANI